MVYSDAITELVGAGAKAYAHKEYEAAADKYAEACERYNEENSSEDPDLLFLYGNALYQHTVMNSQILGEGTGVNGGDAEEEEAKDDDDKAKGNFQFYDDGPLAEEEEADEEKKEEEEEHPKDDEEEEDDEQEQPQQEEQSDFEVAWEILDLTRSLFEDRLKNLESESKDITIPYLQSDKDESDNEYVKTLKKLSETYDILGEVSLEAENFEQAAVDLMKALELRLKLFNPRNSALISEAHYKLSLALEFCVETPDLRVRATQEMKKAIESVELRISHEQDANKVKEYKELIKDLTVRYQELKRDPDEELQQQKAEILLGILGQVASSAASKEESVTGINDLTAGIKKKKKKQTNSEPVVNELTSLVKKRKATPSTGSAMKKSKS